MSGWALDLGTTNYCIARWDESAGQRWLTATVQDLLTRRELMREKPVVRLV